MSKEISRLRIELWCEILDLFSALLKDIPENETEKHSAFIALNRCMTENGVDNFISSLYIAVTSDSSSLRLAVLKFLINLFRHEMTAQKQVSINDIFERKISEEAMKLSRINGSKELLIPENPKRNFGICLADILLQFFSLSSDCQCRLFKCTVANALGSLLAVFQPAQNFCAKQDFATTLILCLKKISVKLSLESAGNIRKLSEKKRVRFLKITIHINFCF